MYSRAPASEDGGARMPRMRREARRSWELMGMCIIGARKFGFGGLLVRRINNRFGKHVGQCCRDHGG